MARKTAAEAEEAPTTTPLTSADIARWHELKALIAELNDEFSALHLRFKEEVPEGTWDSPDGEFTVKRWNQIGNLKMAEFIAAYPITENADLYDDVVKVDVVKESLPPEENPELYTQIPDAGTIKEQLTDAEKEIFFAQVPYVQIKPKG